MNSATGNNRALDGKRQAESERAHENQRIPESA